MEQQNQNIVQAGSLNLGKIAALGAAAAAAGCASSRGQSPARTSSAPLSSSAPPPTPATQASSAAPVAVRPFGGDRINVALIGCGGRGTGAAVDSMRADKSVRIVALADVFKDRLDGSRQQLNRVAEEQNLKDQIAIADDHCFVGFDAYKKALALPEVDLVLLCTPPGFRPMHYQAAIEANKHVFAEKPVAVDPAGIRSWLASSELAKTKGLGVVAGTLFRHHTTHRDAIRQIHDGVFGEIVAGHSSYNVGGAWMKPRQPGWSDVEWQLRNWMYFTWLSGDILVEQDVHRIDIMNWVMKGPPVKVYGMGGRQVRTDPAYGCIYDHFAVEYEYANGARIVNTCRQQDGTDPRVTEYFVGTKGVIEPSKGPKTGKRTKPEPWGAAYVREHKDLIDSIRAGAPLNEGQQIGESCLTAIMGRMSAYTGKTITWEQGMNSKLDLWPRQELAFGPMPVPPVAIPGKEPLI